MKFCKNQLRPIFHRYKVSAVITPGLVWLILVGGRLWLWLVGKLLRQFAGLQTHGSGRCALLRRRVAARRRCRCVDANLEREIDGQHCFVAEVQHQRSSRCCWNFHASSLKHQLVRVSSKKTGHSLALCHTFDGLKKNGYMILLLADFWSLQLHQRFPNFLLSVKNQKWQ